MVAAGSGKPGTPPAQYTEVREGSATVQTGLIDRGITELNKLIEEAGFDPESWMLKPGTGIRKSDWDALRRVDGETIVQPMQSVRMELVQRTVPVNVDELVKIAGDQSVVKAKERVKDGTFGLALGDLQLGKSDGDGPEGTINRFHACVTEAVAKFAISGYGHAHIAFLGDCIEGFTSQGGRNAWRTTLTTTEQVRILRRLMLWAIDQFVDAGAQRITVVSIPGNHDEAMRQPVATRSDDSWAIDALVAVSDAMELSSRYDNVECFVPGPDEMDVTLDLSGVIVTHNHGHQYLKGDHKKSAFDWWSGQKFSGQPAGDADLMFSAHGHHYQVAERSGKTWCMVPALEALSVWWLHRTGQTGDPGVVIFEAANGVLEVLTRIRLREIGTTND